ncbi:MAG: glutamate racemase [Alphaproteobacteria bacterium]|nr:MAG: glutamate racemase [Alphaproteobacteria bacterium]
MTRVLVFDSGVGGLSVLKELRAQSCATSYGYLADNGFFPYGIKSDAALIDRLPKLIFEAVSAYEFDAVVVACNTASTIALDEIRQAIDVPVVGTVPAIKPACGVSHTRVVGLLGTPGTVRRPYTDDLILKFAGDCEVLRHGSAELVELAERKLTSGAIDLQEVKSAIKGLFRQPRGAEIDTVVLACTHFPLLKDELRKAVGRPMQWVDSGTAIARQTKKVLSEISLPAGHLPRADQLLLTAEGMPGRLLRSFQAEGFCAPEILKI